MIKAKIKTAAGAMAWAKLREREPMLRNIMDMHITIVKLKKKNVKNASGVRRKF
jgi:hypothetical protein